LAPIVFQGLERGLKGGDHDAAPRTSSLGRRRAEQKTSVADESRIEEKRDNESTGEFNQSG
jgi:hypothetical protein